MVSSPTAVATMRWPCSQNRLPTILGKNVPLDRGQSDVASPGVMAGDVGAGNYEKERRARYQQREAMNTLGHFRFAIADCRLISDCPGSDRPIGNWQSEIGNVLSASSSIGNSIAGIIGSELGWPRSAAVPPNVKSAVAGVFAVTVTSIVFSVPLAPPSCHATTVYLPGGTPLIVKLPSSPLTAKNGCFVTPT